jgi:MFS family permease
MESGHRNECINESDIMERGCFALGGAARLFQRKQAIIVQRPDTAESGRVPLWTKPFIALTACFFLLFINLQMLLSSFTTYAKTEFMASDLEASLVTSMFALSAIAARFLTVPLMRRVPRHALLLTGLLIAIATTAIYPLAHSYAAFLALRIAYGVGFGIASTILPTLVSGIIPTTRMGEGIGYFGLSTSLALSIGPVIGLNVMKQAGFETLTIVGAVLAAAILPILLMAGTGFGRKKSGDSRQLQDGSPPVRADVRVAAAEPGAQARGPRLLRTLLFPAMLNVLLAITYSGLLSYLALFGEFAGIEQVGLFFLASAVTIILIRPISGKLFDRRGHMPVLIPAGACVAVSMFLLSQAASTGMVIASALVYGIGFGSIQPTIQAWMLRLSPQEQYGSANSLFYNSTDLGVAAGAILLGAISSAAGYAHMYLYSAGFMLLFVLLTIAQHRAALRRVRRSSQQPDRAITS